MCQRNGLTFHTNTLYAPFPYISLGGANAGMGAIPTNMGAGMGGGQDMGMGGFPGMGGQFGG